MEAVAACERRESSCDMAEALSRAPRRLRPELGEEEAVGEAEGEGDVGEEEEEAEDGEAEEEEEAEAEAEAEVEDAVMTLRTWWVK